MSVPGLASRARKKLRTLAQIPLGAAKRRIHGQIMTAAT